MRTHAVLLCLEDRRCVVVGGDAPAADKAALCARAGARVSVVSPEPGEELAALAAGGLVRHHRRPFLDGDLAGAAVAYASTRDPELIRRLVAEAARERVLLNVIDHPEACDFLSPAVVERGDLRIAVGTGGASPALASRLRRRIEELVGPEYGPLVAILGAVRRMLGADPERAAARGDVLAALVASPLLDLLREGRRGEVDVLLGRLVGDACTLDRLGVSLEVGP
jgi:precorrin-2 dehydrogenase/sirohydrochlorin ferrochelatase